MNRNNSRISKLIVSTLILFSLFTALELRIFAINHRANWIDNVKWGVFTHYLTDSSTSASDWNNQINNFDVQYLAQQLKSVGAKYYFITLGQNSGHYCSPNASYDRYVGLRPSKCSKRDLVSDLYKVLKPLGIRLLVYLPSGAPALDSTAVEKLNWSSGPYRNKEFQIKWEAIIKEWSMRWGNKVEGWWFDGAYWPREMYRSKTPPNFQSFTAAAKAGNINSIVAFNPGVKYPITSQTVYEDYTAGEIEEPIGMECEESWKAKAKLHILSYLGSSWGKGLPRFSNEKAIQITDSINKCGGVITWDVPILGNGHIPQAFVNQLKIINQDLEKLSKSKRSKKFIVSKNLALHKKTKILNLNGSKPLPVNSGKYFSKLGVDGDLNTFAMAGDEWAWTYQVDLGKIQAISLVKVIFGKTFATQYEILVSKDKINWSKVAQENNSNGGEKRYKLKPIQARYVNVKALKPNGVGQRGFQMSIAEIEVYN